MLIHMDIQSRELASTKTCRIPELLHIILQHLNNKWQLEKDSTILGCTLVNKLWHVECNRLLWEHCGRHNDDKNPLIRHLVALHGPWRQRNASYIRNLWITSTEQAGTLFWEGRFHDGLSCLKFPILENLRLESPRFSTNYLPVPIAIPIPYSQPCLQTLEIWNYQSSGGVVVGDEFLNELSSNSKNLRVLELYGVNLMTASTQVIVKFFNDMTAITQLKIFQDLTQPTSLEVFLSLSRMPMLQKLETGRIQSDWTERLELGAFPALQYLECVIDSYGLEQFLQAKSDLRSLLVTATSTSTDILTVIALAKPASLLELGVQNCPYTRINSLDLFGIADNAVNLQTLAISDYTEDQEVAVTSDLDDTMFSALARRLPNLKDLSLVFNHSRLTEQSLISLGRHCSALELCHMAAAIDFYRLTQESSLGIFGNLRVLETIDPAEADIPLIVDDNLESVAKALIKLMPKLQQMYSSRNSRLSRIVSITILAQDTKKRMNS